MRFVPIRVYLILLFAFAACLVVIVGQPVLAHDPSGCVIPPSGPWPSCATGGATVNTSQNNSCVIPPSGPWPPCATGNTSTPTTPPTGNNNNCVIPSSGPWPPCATGGQASTLPAPAPTAAPANPVHVREQALLREVINGHTIVVYINGIDTLVRLIGISTPQIDAPCGAEAAGQLGNKIGIRWIELERDVTNYDSTGQLLRYVYIGDRLINAEMVSEGYALATAMQPDVAHSAELYQLQQGAEINQSGCLWERNSPYTG
ncbi:MAG: thermonuclease family protein [Candidatus Promineifilaceae bacterium]